MDLAISHKLVDGGGEFVVGGPVVATGQDAGGQEEEAAAEEERSAANHQGDGRLHHDEGEEEAKSGEEEARVEEQGSYLCILLVFFILRSLFCLRLLILSLSHLNLLTNNLLWQTGTPQESSIDNKELGGIRRKKGKRDVHCQDLIIFLSRRGRSEITPVRLRW